MSIDLSAGNGKVVEITQVGRGDFYDQKIGYPNEGESFVLDFITNFRSHLLPQYLEALGKLDIPEGAVGISEKATGFDEDTGETFPVHDCHGLFASRELYKEKIRPALEPVNHAFWISF